MTGAGGDRSSSPEKRAASSRVRTEGPTCANDDVIRTPTSHPCCTSTSAPCSGCCTSRWGMPNWMQPLGSDRSIDHSSETILSGRSSQEMRFVQLAGGTCFRVEGISAVREVYQRCFVETSQRFLIAWFDPSATIVFGEDPPHLRAVSFTTHQTTSDIRYSRLQEP